MNLCGIILLSTFQIVSSNYNFFMGNERRELKIQIESHAQSEIQNVNYQ